LKRTFCTARPAPLQTIQSCAGLLTDIHKFCLGCSPSASHPHCHHFLGFQLNCLHVSHCTHRPMSLTHDTIPLFMLPSMQTINNSFVHVAKHANNKQRSTRHSTCTKN
jgi:hypothetical protein